MSQQNGTFPGSNAAGWADYSGDIPRSVVSWKVTPRPLLLDSMSWMLGCLLYHSFDQVFLPGVHQFYWGNGTTSRWSGSGFLYILIHTISWSSPLNPLLLWMPRVWVYGSQLCLYSLYFSRSLVQVSELRFCMFTTILACRREMCVATEVLTSYK